MKWYKKLWRFWRTNLENNILKISIGIGAFLSYLVTLIPLPDAFKGATIIVLVLIIMSIFGKNGNGKAAEKANGK